MVNENNNDINRAYVFLTRRIAIYIIEQLRLIEGDAWNEDETGVLDRMHPELESTHWMSAVIRVLSTIRGILEYNRDNPIHRLLIASFLIENDENDENDINNGN